MASTPVGIRRKSGPVVLSYGLGVDSTAILLRWLTDPSSRNFDLCDLIVVSAMTGDEWERTRIDVEAHVLPLMREHGVRFVQVARGRRHVSVGGAGVMVLGDTVNPTRVHLEGAYKLSDEMLEAGTVPQSGGSRLCSVHAKGDALDPIIAQLTGGKPFRHVIGFEANELGRAAKDARYNTALRTGEYPLIEWGWDRARCLGFVKELTGVDWSKSACTYCPFALQNKASRAVVFERYRHEEPEAANLALLMEHVAVALNPAQKLMGTKALRDELVKAGYPDVVERFDAELEAMPFALYEVRRILRGRKDDPTKFANASRSVRQVATGTRAEMEALEEMVRERGDTFPTVEHFFAAAPAVVADKEVAKFESWWNELVTDATVVELVSTPKLAIAS